MKYLRMFFVGSVFLSAVFISTAGEAEAAAVNGYAWSSNVGWISMSSLGDPGMYYYGVAVNSDADLYGYAWSSNVGWISFNAGDLAGCPWGTCKATLDRDTGQVSGWARVLSAPQAAGNAGGWDGWISLRGAGYGVAVSGGGTAASGCTWTGWAWGADVIGWINFGPASSGGNVFGSGYACRHSNSFFQPIANAGPDQTVALPTNSVEINGASASDPSGNTPLTILWSQVNSPSPATIIGGNTLTPTFSDLVEGVYTFRLTVTNTIGQTDTDDMTVTVVASRNLTSSLDPALANGQLIEGETVRFAGQVSNVGNLPVGEFSDNFTYRWEGVGAWTQIGSHINHPAFPAGESPRDDESEDFVLTQFGTLHIQHCVDSKGGLGGEIDETPLPEAEEDNCIVSTFSVENPTGDITSAGCEIAEGNSTCSFDISWASSNVLDPKVYDYDNNLISQDESGSDGPYTVGRGDYTFRLFNGSDLLDSETITIDCDASTLWNTDTSTCEVPPISAADIDNIFIEIVSDPSIVRYGERANLKIITQTPALVDLSCSVLGANSPTGPDDEWTHSGMSNVKDLLTKELKAKQNIHVRCELDGFPDIFKTAEAQILVEATIEET